MKESVASPPVIGLFDSGVGGLSVLRTLRDMLPVARYHYVADSAHCPYGPRDDDEIRGYSRAITQFLLGRGCELVVVACNSASAAALRHLREWFPDVPFVGMVPAVKPAAKLTQSGVVGVMATPTTYHGALYHDVIDRFGRDVLIVPVVCAGLVERIEAGDSDGPATLSLLRACLAPMIQAGADTLVLGCTHYPLATVAIREVVGEGVRILEPSEAIARQTMRLLAERAGADASEQDGCLTLYTSGPETDFWSVSRRILGCTASVVVLTWRDGELELT